ncbi:hypothetical protein EV210_12311 [Anaerospora hongkongensis]|uniref:Fic/DOC family protein n=1 Tax=Anaerospora hongkongensis TaxID=244830 RepID=A0A4R1PVQ8_9FIRM|nr:hypothetical protein [Anaerospora hongkongensis]TCL32191.1 hypothetical protein EV210_12311 [Anaerospora hongkongensis]
MLFDYIYKVVIPKNMIKDAKFALFSAKRMLPEYIFDISQLENNPITFPEVKTLFDGVSVDGHTINDVQQVLNIMYAWQLVLEAVKTNTFNVTKDMFCRVNARIVGSNTYPASLNPDKFDRELPTILENKNEIEQAIHLFLWATQNKFYQGGNKRTARLIGSGILLKAGYGVFNISAKDINEFNTLMADFYENNQADSIIRFLAEKCIVYIEK